MKSLQELRSLLAQKVVLQSVILRYVNDAGIPSQYITLQGDATTMWDSAINAAHDRVFEGIPKLINLIMEDYQSGTPVNTQLKKILSDYEREMKAGSDTSSETTSPSDTLNNLIRIVDNTSDWDYILDTITSLSQQVPGLSTMEDQIILLRARINNLNRENSLGTIANEQFKIETNRLTQSLLSVLRNMKKRIN
ncbi:MAG: hypothetical protein AAF824_05495 [Bacteroidota bacterium]